MKADVSRFFYTAYTHSIPWAIIGKEKVKNWLLHDKKKLIRHWSNDLDHALQACQSRETFGIPVGPDTSRVIAEVLLAGVEADKDYASAVKGRPAVRLLDDFVVGFDNEDAAHSALVALRNALWKFNLQLNEEKTSIIQSRLHFREKWRIEIESITISGSDEEKQDRDIYRLIDLALHLCSEHRTSAPAHWACVRLSQLKIIDGNFRTVLDAMIRLGRDFPSCTNHVAAFLINNQSRCSDLYSRTKIEKWVKATLRRYIRHSHEFEIAWCLLVSGVFRIRIGENDIGAFKPIPNSVTFSILGMLRERRLLAVPLSKWEWRGIFKKDGVYGRYWLPFYESVRRNWTNDKGIISAVTSDPILKRMLEANVTFLEDQVLDATNIDIRRRVFRKKPPYPAFTRADFEDDEEMEGNDEDNDGLVVGDYDF